MTWYRCEQPEPGCCGMAGAFGFERGEHYDVSMKIAERALLPAARRAPEDTLLIADGFSCREQIEQTTGRHPLHLAEVLSMALRSEPSYTRADDGRRRTAVDGVPPSEHAHPGRRVLAAAGIAGAAVATGTLAWETRRKKPR